MNPFATLQGVRSALVACSLVACATLLPAVADAAPPESPEKPEVVQPVLLNQVELSYPDELLALDPRPAGTVVVRYVVGVDGVPTEAEVVDSVHPVLDQTAVAAVKKLRYEPATYEGRPVELVLSIGLEIVAPLPEPEVTEPEAPEDETEGEDEQDPDEGPVQISGVLRMGGQRTPIVGSTVLAFPAGELKVGQIKKRRYDDRVPEWERGATTDEEGKFELRGLPPGKVRLVFVSQGYERLEWVVEIKEDEIIEAKYYQVRKSTNPFRTEVDVERDDAPEINRRTITVEELSKVPGTQGDALKAIQNFPGVARAPFGGGLIAIRGAAPEDSAIYLGYHEIPVLFHFGGLTSVFNSDLLTQIDYIPGNFDSRYGDAIGGVVNVVPRKGRRDGYHGYIDADVFDAGILFEGPIGKGSFAVSGRRSYIDFLLNNAIPDDAGLAFSIAPRYYDYQVLFDYPLGGGDFSIRAFGSDDRTKLVFAEENDIETDERNGLELTQWFHRGDVVYRKVNGPWEFLVTPSYRRDFFEINAAGFLEIDATVDTVSTRAEITRRLSQRARLRVGTQFEAYWFNFGVTAPGIPNPDGSPGTSETQTREDTDFFLLPSLYTTLTLKAGERLTFYPGVRVVWYDKPMNEIVVDPRLRAAWDIAENTTIKAGVGLYSQAPQGVEVDEVFGNPNLHHETALHTSLAVAQGWGDGWNAELTGFYKELYWMIAPSNELVSRDGQIVPELYANHGTGRIYGLEFLLRKNLTKNFFGWVSYTLSRSVRRDGPGEDLYIFDFDQTHIFTAIASYKLPRGWQVGARFRLVSGNPLTPTTDAAFDAESGFFTPISGPRNSDRYPTFHQLDLRVDKTWTGKFTRFSLYLDLQNAYNRQNVEFLNYSYDYKLSNTINGLPIIPSLGMKLEF